MSILFFFFFTIELTEHRFIVNYDLVVLNVLMEGLPGNPLKQFYLVQERIEVKHFFIYI